MNPNQDPWKTQGIEPKKEIDAKKISETQKPSQETEQKTSILAILSLIFSLTPVGLILAIIARIKISNNPNLKGKALTLIALIISILSVVALATVIVLVLFLEKFSLSFI